MKTLNIDEAKLEDILDWLCSPNANEPHRDTFREILLDVEKIMRGVCRYAERVAKKKRVPPWSVISKMTNNGSGVSSAIYELYRDNQKEPHE